MNINTDAVWQNIGEDNWVFGVPSRGLVRDPLAEMYFDPGISGKDIIKVIEAERRAAREFSHGKVFTADEIAGTRDYGWVWFVSILNGPRGVANTIQRAAEEAERALSNMPEEAEVSAK